MLDEGPAPRRIVNSSSPRPSPTFVQIREPAAAGGTKRTVGILLGGLVLVGVLAWLVPREPLPPSAPAQIGSAAPQTAAARPIEPSPPTPEPEALALQEAPSLDDTAAAAGSEPSPLVAMPAPEPQPAMPAPVVET